MTAQQAKSVLQDLWPVYEYSEPEEPTQNESAVFSKWQEQNMTKRGCVVIKKKKSPSNSQQMYSYLKAK